MHGDMVGGYPLVMPMTTEQAVVGGRETFGEPKKLADVTLQRDGDVVRGWFARMGVTFVEINGRITGEFPPTARSQAQRLLLQVPARSVGQGIRRRSGARVLPPRGEDTHRCSASTARSRCASRGSIPSPTCPCGRCVRSSSPSGRASSTARSSRRCRASGSARSCTSATTTCRSSAPQLIAMTSCMKDLAGRVAVVTGGAGGLGRAMGERFAREGMRVVLADVQAEPLDKVVAECQAEGLDIIGVQTDVTNYASVDALRDADTGRVRRRPRRVQQRRYRCRRRRPDVGARAQRLAVGDRRQRDGRGARHQCVRAGDARTRRRGPRRQHVVGQRWRVATAEHTAVRGDQGRGRHDHRVPLRPAARGRRADRRVRALPRTAHPAHRVVRVVAQPHGGVRQAAPAVHAVHHGRSARGADEGGRSRDRLHARSRRSPTRVVAGIRAGDFWIHPQSDRGDAQLLARTDSMLHRTNPTYLRAVPG